MRNRTSFRRAVAGGAAATALLLGGVAADVAPRQPSHDRAWAVEQSRMPDVRLDGASVAIRHVRDFRHHADRGPDEGWFDAEYDAAGVARVWFVLSPFNPRMRGLAHPFLSFEFDDGRFLAVSVEARKQAGQRYSTVLGMMRRYETMMVIGTEQDLLGLRAVAWEDPLYVFPVRVTREQAGELFVRMMQRAAQLAAEPEFYHTITNNCTTNLMEPINAIAAAERQVGRSVGLLPGYSYEAAYRRGWIDTELPLEQTRRVHRVNERVRAHMDAPDFSRRVRLTEAQS